MATDADVTVDPDDADLRDAECASCLGTRSVRDADSGESRPCPLCASSASSASATTLEFDVQTPEVVRQSLAGELSAHDSSGGRRSMLSPMASLSRWSREYLDAEHAFRLIQARFMSDVDGSPAASAGELGRALRRVALAEFTLREATGVAGKSPDLSDLERERVDLLGALIDLPVPDGARPALADALGAVRRDVVSSATSGERPSGRIRRVLGALGRALGRLRRGWEPTQR